MKSDAADWWDAIAETYDESYPHPADWAENHYVQQVLSGVLRWKADPHVLDLGCGTGLLLDLVPLPEDRYVGTDISPRMIDKAKEKHPFHTFFDMDAETTLGYVDPDEEYMFDVVTMLFGTLSYLHPANALRKTFYALKPGGSAVVMAYGKRRMKGPVTWWQQPGGVLMFSPDALAALATSLGFRVKLCHSLTRFRLPSRLLADMQNVALSKLPRVHGNHTIAVLEKP